ncbi:hypothetical protein ACTFIR_002236 [Dictyostelium discoideum]
MNNNNNNNVNDNNEILFWKVFKNVVIRNLIFKVMGEQVIEYDDMKKYYIGNRVKFSNMTLALISKNKLWTILKDKLISNQYIRIDKKGLSSFFENCNEDLDTIKLLYKFKKEEINSIIDPINQSIENENELALKYFINYIDEETGMKLPISFDSIQNGFYKHINTLSMLDVLYKELRNKLNNNNSSNNNNKNNNNNKIDIIKVFNRLIVKNEWELLSYIFDNCLDVFIEPKELNYKEKLGYGLFTLNYKGSDEFRTKCFKSGFIEIKNTIPIYYILNNYTQFSYQDCLFLLKINYYYNKNYNNNISVKQVNDLIEEMVEKEGLKYKENVEFEKFKFIKFKIAKEYDKNIFYKTYFYEFDDRISKETTDLSTIAEYTFSSFSINGLNCLIENSFKFPQHHYVMCNLSKIEEIKGRIVQFFKIYFENDNHLNIEFSSWKSVSELIFSYQYPFEIINELLDVFPDSHLPFITGQLNNFTVKCPSTTVKIIQKFCERIPNVMYLKRENYFKALEFYFEIYTEQQVDDLKFFEKKLFINVSNDQESISTSTLKAINNYYSVLSLSLKSIEAIKRCLINYPNAEKAVICKKLYIGSLNNLDIEKIKEFIEIIGIQDINSPSFCQFPTNFNFKKLTNITQVENILNNLNQLQFPTIKINPKLTCIFFNSLFDSFSFKELIENCPSFKLIDFNLFPNESLELVITDLIKSKRYEIILFILNQLSSNSRLCFKYETYSNYLFEFKSGEININFNFGNPNLIIQVLNEIIKKTNIQESSNLLVFQILFNELVKCKNINFDQINLFLEICKSNKIQLTIGFYHIIYYFNIKNLKLSNYLTSLYLPKKISPFSMVNKYNCGISFDLGQFPLDVIEKLSTSQLLKKLVILSKPLDFFKNNIDYLFKINEDKLALISMERYLKTTTNKDSVPSHIIKLLFKSYWFSNISNVIYVLENIKCIPKNLILERATLKKRLDIMNLILTSNDTKETKK